MDHQQLEAMFLLAGVKLWNATAIPNGYSRSRPDPWWQVQTDYGVITVGWRKRVISIEWPHTGIHCIVTRDNVTKDTIHVHAHSLGDAVNYLREWQRQAELPVERRQIPLQLVMPS